MTVETLTAAPMGQGGSRIRSMLVALVVIAGVLTVTTQAGAQISVSEYKLKSAYIYSFGNYTTWPIGMTRGRTDIVIGVCGATPIFAPLSKVAAKRRINGRQIRLELPQTHEERSLCDIVFVARSVPEEEQKKIILELADEAVLLVGENPNFIANGGMVEFRLQETTVKFDINVEATKKANLVLNAKLLRLASKPTEVSSLPLP